ncbi:hypothetical protein ACMFMG_011793 [Clarireedia jacksonii]
MSLIRALPLQFQFLDWGRSDGKVRDFYLPLNYDCWNTMKQSNDNIKSNVQATSTTAPSKHMHTSKGDNMALNLHNITNISQLPVEILELILEQCDLGSLDSVMMRSKHDRILDVAMDRSNPCVYFRKLTSRPKC